MEHRQNLKVQADGRVHIDDVALFLNLKKRTLLNWRNKGFGPPSFKVGKNIWYFYDVLVAWMADLGTQ